MHATHSMWGAFDGSAFLPRQKPCSWHVCRDSGFGLLMLHRIAIYATHLHSVPLNCHNALDEDIVVEPPGRSIEGKVRVKDDDITDPRRPAKKKKLLTVR